MQYETPASNATEADRAPPYKVTSQDIVVTGLSKIRIDGENQRRVLHNLELTLTPGEIVAITGPSGCGKSTLLHILGGLEEADEGAVQVAGEDILQYSEKQLDHYRQYQVGMIFQQFNLIDCLSVKDNVFFQARLTQRVDEMFVAELCKTLGITELLHKMPYQISGGEQQRVAVARAIAHRPNILLADEPTGNLDEHNSQVVAKLLIDACKQYQQSLLLVTHSVQVANLAERNLVLHDGRLG